MVIQRSSAWQTGHARHAVQHEGLIDMLGRSQPDMRVVCMSKWAAHVAGIAMRVFATVCLPTWYDSSMRLTG